MDTTIRNIDESVFRKLKARAALEGKTIGELLNEAIKTFLDSVHTIKKKKSLLDITPQPFPKGTEKLSEEVDSILYGK